MSITSIVLRINQVGVIHELPLLDLFEQLGYAHATLREFCKIITTRLEYL